MIAQALVAKGPLRIPWEPGRRKGIVTVPVIRRPAKTDDPRDGEGADLKARPFRLDTAANQNFAFLQIDVLRSPT